MSKPLQIPYRFLHDTPARQNLKTRFWQRVRKSSVEGCWEWTSPSPDGYGRISIAVGGMSFNLLVHRLSYAWEYGDPYPQVLDHLCANTSCVNPKHLQAVTPKINVLRGGSPSAINAQKLYCGAGHPLYGENLRVDEDGKRRTCRACADARYEKWADGKVTFKRHGSKKTHCVNGHPWVEENIRVKKNGHHECRLCYLAHKREWSKKRRAREKAVREATRGPTTAERILSVLGEGATVAQVAEELSLSRAAVSMSINRLEGRDEIETVGTVRGKGPAKRIWRTVD